MEAKSSFNVPANHVGPNAMHGSCRNLKILNSSTIHDHQLTQHPSSTMASLTATSRAVLRSLPRSSSLPIRALSTSSSKCRPSVTDSSFDSPFKGAGGDANSKIPDFSKYRSKQGSNTNLLFQYFMVGE